MKRLVIFTLLTMACTVCFAENFKTGEAMPYFTESALMVENKSGDSSSCYISKIAKASGYPSGTYELTLVSADWIGATVFPVQFTYIVKQGDELEFLKITSIYSGREDKKLKEKSVSDNSIEFEDSDSLYKILKNQRIRFKCNLKIGGFL